VSPPGHGGGPDAHHHAEATCTERTTTDQGNGSTVESTAGAAAASDASRRRDRIKLLIGSMTTTTEKIAELLDAAQAEQDHVALGYASWPAYVAGEFADALAGLSTAARRPAVAALAEGGLSTRAIAEIAGVGQSTVGRDLLQVTRSGSPEGGTVVGLDGKSYAANRPAQPHGGRFHEDRVPTEAELGENVIRLLAEQAPDLLPFVHRALEQWPHQPQILGFARVAVPALMLGHPEWLSGWLYSAAQCALEECEDVRRARNAPDWTLPGVEALAGIVAATHNPALLDSTRGVLESKVEDQLVAALVQSEWAVDPGILRAIYNAAGV